MKTLLALALTFFVASAHFTQAAADFTEFEGTYEGTYTLTAGSTVLTGKLKMLVMPVGKGKSTVVELLGAITQAGAPAPYASYAKMKLKSNRNVISNSTLIGFYQLVPTSSKYTGRKKKFKFTLTESTVLGASMSYVLKFTKKGVVLNGAGAAGSTPITVSFTGKKK